MDDYRLSEHFTFFELTKTNNGTLLYQNRVEAEIYVPTGKDLAEALEFIRGDEPLFATSGFRGRALNAVTPGSSEKSQHLLFQAGDVCRPLRDCRKVFEEILAKIEAARFPFGQLIYEEIDRGYKAGKVDIARWIHFSLGLGYRAAHRCGEVLENINGKWTLIKRLKH